jgi:general secretion pathway protein D
MIRDSIVVVFVGFAFCGDMFAAQAVPPRGESEASTPAEPPDPTVPDAVLETAFGARATGSANPSLPSVVLRGVVASADGIPDVAIEAGTQIVRLRENLQWTTPEGVRLRVAALRRDGAELESITHGETIAVDFGALPPANLDAPPIMLVDFRAIPIEHACRMLAERAGKNVVPSRGAATLSISLYLRDVDATTAVRALCEAYQLWFRDEAGSSILRISTVEEYRRDLSDIQEERTAVFTLQYPNVFDVAHAIRDLFGDRVQLNTSAAQDDALLDLSDRLSRFDIFDGRTQGFGQNNSFGSASGFGNEFGGGSAQVVGGRYGGALNGLGGRIDESGRAVSDVIPIEKESVRPESSAEEIRALEELLAQRDADVASAEDVSRELARRFVAPIHVTAAARQSKLLVRTSDQAAMQQIRELIAELDVPMALVLLEFRILSIDLGDGAESFFEYQWGGSDDDAHGSLSLGAIAAPNSGLGPGGTGLRTGDLVFQFVDSNFGLRVQALEKENRVRTLATPILLTANNEVSRLFIGREVPLNRSFTGGQTLINESTSTTATGTTSIEFRPVGTTLLVTANINADRSCTLRIVQENSDLNSTAEVLVPSGTAFVPQTVDVVSSQTVSGTIVARDELAVAFGGLIEHGKSEDVSGIPFLRDIPYLGVLFEHREMQDTHREIVIVVKPYVIATPADFESVPATTLENLGVDLDAFHTDPATGEVLSPKGPFRTKIPYRVHGVDGLDIEAGVRP